MKELIIIIILFCCPIISKGEGNIDSLLTIWENQSNADTVRVAAVNKISSNKYLFSKSDSAFFFSETAYNFSKIKNLKKEMAIALNAMGSASNNKANYPKAIDFKKKSIEISESTEDIVSVSKTLNSLGNVYLTVSDYANAVDCY